MAVIDLRIRPPLHGFLDMVMYASPERRDNFTRSLKMEPAQSVTEQSMDMLMEEMDSAEIETAVVVGRNSGFLGSVPNEDVKKIVDAYSGRFLGAASIDPTSRRGAMDTIEKWVVNGDFKAVNIEPGSYPSPLHSDDRRLYPIYGLCEDHDIPVLMMTGGNAGPDISYTNPEHLDRVLADFPKLRICATHGNWPWVTEIIHLAYRRPNLYLSPDMYLANMPGMNDYIAAADGFLQDRFLYASSYPFLGAKAYLDWFRTLPINDKSMEKVTYHNAKRFLGL